MCLRFCFFLGFSTQIPLFEPLPATVSKWPVPNFQGLNAVPAASLSLGTYATSSLISRFNRVIPSNLSSIPFQDGTYLSAELLFGLPKIVVDLHPVPEFRGGAERFG